MEQHLIVRLCLAIALLITLAGAAVTSSTAALSARAVVDRPVMAFYYPWYEPGDWTSAEISDQAAPTYAGGDDAALRRHLRQAADAGIDALICTWYGPTEERLNKRCRRLLQMAEESGGGVRIALIPDQSAAFDPVLRTEAGLAAALGALRRDFTGSPAYFTFRGKPVVFWFNPPSLGGIDAWRRVRDLADPGREQFWFGGTDDFGYMAAFDTLYYYDITWEAAPGAAMASYAGRLNAYNAGHGEARPFVGTVMPGYDDTRARPDGHLRDRAGGDYYRGTWRDVADRAADAVVLTSFNEFYEGTYVEPSARFGDLYLRLTWEGVDRFRGAAGPPAAPAPADGCRPFPETGHAVCGPFLAHWTTHGGLALNGFPLADAAVETLGDGQPHRVQYFERVRLELRVDPATGQPLVMLGQLGRQLHPAEPPVPALPGALYFAETGHNVGRQAFADYWHAHGGLAQFGFPLGEEAAETLDGQTYRMQYFERARFEWHPEIADPAQRVQLGQFGRVVCGERCR